MRGHHLARRHKKMDAAEALRLSSGEALRLGIIDEVIGEPVPAHLDHNGSAERLAAAVLRNVEELRGYSVRRLLGARYWRFRRPI